MVDVNVMFKTVEIKTPGYQLQNNQSVGPSISLSWHIMNFSRHFVGLSGQLNSTQRWPRHLFINIILCSSISYHDNKATLKQDMHLMNRIRTSEESDLIILNTIIYKSFCCHQWGPRSRVCACLTPMLGPPSKPADIFVQHKTYFVCVLNPHD